MSEQFRKVGEIIRVHAPGEGLWAKVTSQDPLEAKLLNAPVVNEYQWGEIVRLEYDRFHDTYEIRKHEGVVDETPEVTGE